MQYGRCRTSPSRNNKYNFDQISSGSEFLGIWRAECIMPEVPSYSKKEKISKYIRKFFLGKSRFFY